MAPDEGRKIKAVISEFLSATIGFPSYGKLEINSIKKEKNQVEVHGKVDVGGLLEYKWMNFTIVLDENFRLLSYERVG
jgi:hypothetical protein